MTSPISRRRLLRNSLAAGALGAVGASHADGPAASEEVVAAEADTRSATMPPPDSFPSQDPARARETVLWAHSDIDKVARIVEDSPELANAAIDWGFGDWESAVGAAAHMGRRDMAELLLKHGARPDIFTHAMLGHLDAVRAIVAGMPGIQGTYGPHGISLLAHAKAGKEKAAAVVDYLEEIGGADPAHDIQPLVLPVAAYTGLYVWKGGEGDGIVVSERDGTLRLTRGEGFPQRVWHKGGHAFAPFAHGSVTVRFEVAGGETIGLSVWDPGKVVSARRVVAAEPATQ